MGISLHKFPQYNIELFIYSGAVRFEEIIRHFQRIDPAANWFSYFDSRSDLTAIDLAHFPEMKRAITAKEDELPAKLPRRHALVSVPRRNERFVQFWCDYACAGVPNAHARDMFGAVRGACRWLGLPRDGCETVLETIAEHEAELSGRSVRAPWDLRASPE